MDRLKANTPVMPQSTALHDRSSLVQEFVVGYIYDQNFSDNNGVPKKRLIRLLRDKFCHDVRDVDSEQKVKREMEHAVRIMVSQMIIQSVEIPGCMVAFRLHDDFNLRGMVRLPKSREPSIEVENNEESMPQLVFTKASVVKETARASGNTADAQAEIEKIEQDTLIRHSLISSPGNNEQDPNVRDMCGHSFVQSEASDLGLPQFRDRHALYASGNSKSREPVALSITDAEPCDDNSQISSAHASIKSTVESMPNVEQFVAMGVNARGSSRNLRIPLQQIVSKDQFEICTDMSEVSATFEKEPSHPLSPSSMPEITNCPKYQQSSINDDELQHELMLQEELLQEQIAQEEMPCGKADQRDVYIEAPQNGDGQTGGASMEKDPANEAPHVNVAQAIQDEVVAVDVKQLKIYTGGMDIIKISSREVSEHIRPALSSKRTEKMQLEQLQSKEFQVDEPQPEENELETLPLGLLSCSKYTRQDWTPREEEEHESSLQKEDASDESGSGDMQLETSRPAAAIHEKKMQAANVLPQKMQIDIPWSQDSQQVMEQSSTALSQAVKSSQSLDIGNAQSNSQNEPASSEETAPLEEAQSERISYQEMSGKTGRQSSPQSPPTVEHSILCTDPDYKPEGSTEEISDGVMAIDRSVGRGQDSSSILLERQSNRPENVLESSTQEKPVSLPIIGISPRARRQVMPDVQDGGGQERIAESLQNLESQPAAARYLRGLTNSLLDLDAESLADREVRAMPSTAIEQGGRDCVLSTENILASEVELENEAQSELPTNPSLESRSNPLSRRLSSGSGITSLKSVVSTDPDRIYNLLSEAHAAMPEELVLMLETLLNSRKPQILQSEELDPVAALPQANTISLPSDEALESNSAPSIGIGIQHDESEVPEQGTEPASEARLELESALDIDNDIRMDENSVLDSSQPILTPSRKRRRVMEIAPSDQSSYFDLASPSLSIHSTPQRLSKRVCTPLSGSLRLSSNIILSHRESETSIRPIAPELFPKRERRPDTSEPWLKQAVQVLREQYPHDDLETDNGEILCVDCNKRIKPTKTGNVTSMGTHLRSKAHKDKKEKRGEGSSLTGAQTLGSNNGYNIGGFDASTSLGQIDTFVRKEDNNAAYYRELAHKAEQDAAKAKIVREQHLISQFASLEDSSQGRFNKIESSLEVLRREQRRQDVSTSDKFTLFEDTNRDQMSNLMEQMSHTESQLTESQKLIAQAKEHVTSIETRTTSGLDSMFSTLARSDHRNIEQIEKQASEHAKLAKQINKQNQNWWSRLDDAASKIETMQTLIEDRDDIIQNLLSQSDVRHRAIEQMSGKMRTFQEQIEVKMEAQAREHDIRIASMRREFTTRTEEMLEKLSNKTRDNERRHSAQVQELERQHHVRIKKLERRNAKQQQKLDRHEAMFPVILADAGDLRVYCEEVKEVLTAAAAEPPRSPTKKKHKSRTGSAAP